MAKLPGYLKIGYGNNRKFVLTIKKWGYPILIYKVLKERYSLKWYQWVMYPFVCIKLMCNK